MAYGSSFDELVEELRAEERNNPRARDPKEWSCLSDEQREVIARWHAHEVQKSIKLASEEKKAVERKNETALFMFAIPFAAYYAYRAAERNADFFDIVLEVVAALFLYSVLAIISYTVGKLAQEDSSCSKWGRRFRLLGYAAAYGFACWVVISMVK